jgi:outer membrane protein TolC
MKWIFLSCIFLSYRAYTQEVSSLSLEKAYEKAKQNYPLVKQRGLIKQTADITIENLNKGFLPQASLSGQATYQSEVTEVKIPVPGVTITPLSKDQYKLLADVNQLIYDGGTIRQQKEMQQLNAAAEQEKIEVELYKLKERINQIFLSVLLLEEQSKQVDLIKSDLKNGIKRVEAQVSNGVAFRSNLNILKAELLKSDQRLIEIKASQKGLLSVLSLFINESLPENAKLEKPVIPTPSFTNSIQRPELKLFVAQEKLLLSQNKFIDAKNLPKASLFAQGGYGRPGLNFLQNEFSFFYTTGLRFNWSLAGLYTRRNEKQIVEVNKKIIDIQKENFLLNTNTALKQQQSEIEKLELLISKDKEIVDLRSSIKETAKAQLENGVITANDFLREVNAEDQARQSLIAHQLQLLQAQINYRTISGNN